MSKDSFEQDKEWIGVDLDGTLATWTTWTAFDHIGLPIPKMVTRIKRWRKERITVKILTARASTLNRNNLTYDEFMLGMLAIENWCLINLGEVLEITAEKDHHMKELWDDRAIQVQTNTGEKLC